VLADVNAPMLYRELVGADHLPADLMADLERFHWDDATVKVDWNLDGPIPWTAEPARRAGTVHLAEGVDALTLAASELARGLVPARPFLLMGQQSLTDPTRQPEGKETAWAYTHVPRRIKGDAGAADGPGISGEWTASDAERIADRIEGEIEVVAPGFRALIRGRHVMTPPMFEAENPNLDGSAINGGTAQLHQQLIFRPVPGFGRPETPIKGLYLASGSAHPGGGVHGAAGANAAKAALAGQRVRKLFHRSGEQLGP
jgi:phytoene dehydrogenase-like protein